MPAPSLLARATVLALGNTRPPPTGSRPIPALRSQPLPILIPWVVDPAP